MTGEWYIVTHEARVRSREWRGEYGRAEVAPTGTALGEWRSASDRAARKARRGRFGK
jgi:hypothetical protein